MQKTITELEGLIEDLRQDFGTPWVYELEIWIAFEEEFGPDARTCAHKRDYEWFKAGYLKGVK